jgi:enoyl-CoA hydratase/carnithine racemase
MSLQRERIDAQIEVLRLDRPEVRNAMDSALLAQLLAALEDLARDDELRVLVFSTTSERALCAGADVGEQLSAEQGVARMEAFARFYTAVAAFPAPTIAVCVGNCVGAGAELVAGCDLRVAGENLKLAWAGARLGVPVGPARLAPLVGLSIAKDLVFSGRVVGAEEAAALHLAHRRAPAAEAEAVALQLARELCANDGPGLRRLKRMFAEYDDTAARITSENAELVDFQRHGGGLPQK